MTRQTISIPSIDLEWSEWYPWNELLKDARKADGIKIPNKLSGVYEAKYEGEETQERLTIGRASDLRMRIRQALIKGKVPHSSGEDIRALNQSEKIVIRWAITNRPCAVEEELHRLYKLENDGELPLFTDRT